MPKTPKIHFVEDTMRAKSLIVLAEKRLSGSSTPQLVRDDVLRSAWMFTVAALDAYACDAYADMLSSLFSAKQKEKTIDLPEKVTSNIMIPAFEMLRDYKKKDNCWRWRNASNTIMEKQNILSMKVIKEKFNPFLPLDRRLFKISVISDWINRPHYKHRFFGISRSEYNRLTYDQKRSKLQDMTGKLESVFTYYFQRRHDCIHNVDRPRYKPTAIKISDAEKALEDVRFFVMALDNHINIEYRSYLLSLGFSKKTVNEVGYTIANAKDD